MNKKKMVLVTTVPSTLETIFRGQPGHLASFYDLTLLSGEQNRLDDFSRAEGNIPYMVVPMVRGINPLSDIVSIWKMIEAFRKLKPDLVQSYTPKAGMVAMVAAWICRVPVRIHTFTGLIFPTSAGLKKKILILVDRLTCACATHIVPEGDGVKNDLIDYSITKKPLKKIGYGNIAGVDLDYFNPGSEEVLSGSRGLFRDFSLPVDSFLFCFVGRLNKDKGLTELVQAFKNLPDKAYLLIVGGLDDTAPISEFVIEEIEKNPRIIALGFQKDVRAALHLSDILVLPSYREGFPNVVLQAGAMGLPAIVTDVNGSNEIIEHGVNGWIVPSKNVAALQEAMELAMKQSNLDEMGQVAQERIRERFEQKAHWKRLREFYDRALQTVQ